MDEVVEGIRDELEHTSEELAIVTRPILGGVRLCLESPSWLPALGFGFVDLHFTPIPGGLTEVRVRARRRRRWWVPPMLAGLAVGAVVLDLAVAAGYLSLMLIERLRHVRTHHRDNDPLLLDAVAGFLTPRDLGRVDAAPFRRALSEPC
jgi:hypothetical protein